VGTIFFVCVILYFLNDFSVLFVAISFICINFVFINDNFADRLFQSNLFVANKIFLKQKSLLFRQVYLWRHGASRKQYHQGCGRCEAGRRVVWFWCCQSWPCVNHVYHTLNRNAAFWLVQSCALICNVLFAVRHFFWFLHGIKCRTASDFIVWFPDIYNSHKACHNFYYHTLNWNAAFWLVEKCALICDVMRAVRHFFWFLHGIKCRTASDFIVFLLILTHIFNEKPNSNFASYMGLEPLSWHFAATPSVHELSPR